jgi:hypothetical protein
MDERVARLKELIDVANDCVINNELQSAMNVYERVIRECNTYRRYKKISAIKTFPLILAVFLCQIVDIFSPKVLNIIQGAESNNITLKLISLNEAFYDSKESQLMNQLIECILEKHLQKFNLVVKKFPKPPHYGRLLYRIKRNVFF